MTVESKVKRLEQGGFLLEDSWIVPCKSLQTTEVGDVIQVKTGRTPTQENAIVSIFNITKNIMLFRCLKK